MTTHPSDREKQLLQQIWPDHCAIVGDDALENILTYDQDSDFNLVNAPGASQLDLMGVISVLASGATFLSLALQFWDRTQRRELQELRAHLESLTKDTRYKDFEDKLDDIAQSIAGFTLAGLERQLEGITQIISSHHSDIRNSHSYKDAIQVVCTYSTDSLSQWILNSAESDWREKPAFFAAIIDVFGSRDSANTTVSASMEVDDVPSCSPKSD